MILSMSYSFCSLFECYFERTGKRIWWSICQVFIFFPTTLVCLKWSSKWLCWVLVHACALVVLMHAEHIDIQNTEGVLLGISDDVEKFTASNGSQCRNYKYVFFQWCSFRNSMWLFKLTGQKLCQLAVEFHQYVLVPEVNRKKKM